MPYINRAMTDGGGGSKTTFNYSAPKTITKPKIAVPAPKANTDTQTRYEQQQLAAQTAANAAAKARADATFAAINAQKIETARLAQEAYARAQAAAEAARLAEIKRQKIERDNWENWQANDTVQSKPKVLASAVPPGKPKQSFWQQASDVSANILNSIGAWTTNPANAGFANVPLPVAKANAVAAKTVNYSSFMQPKGPALPGQTPFGPLQDRFTGEDKLSYQSHSPSYWEKASPDKFNFNRYPNGDEVAKEAEAAYQSFSPLYKDQLAKNKVGEKSIGVDPLSQLAGLVGSMGFGGSITAYEDAIAAQKNVNNLGTGVDPTTEFGQRLMMENAGQKVPTYAQTWQDMRIDRNDKAMAAGNLTTGYNKLQTTKAQVPTEKILANLSKFRVNTIEDYYKYVWNQDDPNTSLSSNTRMVGGTDPNTGEYMILPMEYFLGDRSMWDQGLIDKAFGGGHTVMNGSMYGGEDTALHNPRRPLAKDANDPFLDYYVNPKIDRGWAINETAPVAEAVTPDYGGGGGGGYGDGSGYGSGGSYWSPSGYYDNQYTKERYGSFQNLAKWVI